MKTNSFWDSIYMKLLLELLFLAFIPIVLIISVFFYLNQQNNADIKYELNDRVTNSIIANINNNTEFTSRTTQSLLSSNELISFLNNDYSMEMDYNNYTSSIQSYIQATINADPRSAIYIYMDNPTIPMSMDVFYHLSDISAEAPIADFLNSSLVEQWFCESDFAGISNPYLFPAEKCFIYLRKAYDFRKNFLGVIAFSIPEKYFLSFENEGDETVISSGCFRIINLSGNTLSEDTLSTIQSSGQSYAQMNGFLVTLSQPEDFPISIITVTKNSNYGQLIGVFLLLLGLFAILSILLCLRSLQQMERQMNECLSAMDISIINNYKTRIPVSGNNEISHICRRINLLLTQAAELSRQNILKETSNKESRLIALQHQINPHFIYNTMEVFSSKMKLYGHYEESDCLVAFANIFRYNISTNDALVEVHIELEQLRNYLRIQKLRYPMISFVSNIPDRLMTALLPKFTLQPIIENAISHGISDSSHALFITVSVNQKGERLLFCLKDNGTGISPEKLSALNHTLHNTGHASDIASDGHSVGLKNVNTRLELYFGKESRLSVASIPGQETCVSFEIPYRLPEL
ncbi:hypothetical protein D7V86_08355 [bacterium D16-51]|nr:hypothetical protein D7V96_08340 [bacterium D16-59]RKI60605.1 hypothetical protein D7V86_08355 [bacterium D16-51]